MEYLSPVHRPLSTVHRPFPAFSLCTFYYAMQVMTIQASDEPLVSSPIARPLSLACQAPLMFFQSQHRICLPDIALQAH